MYQALYRKYRPINFSDVLGQDHITLTLKNQISQNEISHAYLFTGTRGTGKTTCAKIFARAINCLNPVSGDPCNECENCKGILNESIMDIIEIDAASNNGVDNIRQIREDIQFTPAKAKYKVYIIDEVHMLSGGAFNALLKTLEEPPSHVVFILATTEIQKIPATILSRCQRFDFKRISHDDISKRINEVAQKEDIKISEKATDIIARNADGALRDALSILERCAGISKEIDENLVYNALGMFNDNGLIDAIKAIFEKNIDYLLNFFSKSQKESKDITKLFMELSSIIRDLIIIKVSSDSKSLVHNLGCYDKLLEIKDNASISSLINITKILQQGIYDVSRFADKRTMAEIALIKLVYNFDDEQPVKPVKKNIKPIVKTENEKPKEALKPEPESKKSGDEACRFFDKILDMLNMDENQDICALLTDASAFENDSVLTIKIDDDFKYMVLSQPDKIDAIKKAAFKATGKEYSVIILKKESVSKEVDDFDELIKRL